MTPQPSYLFTSLKQPDDSGVTALVVYGLVTAEHELFYLVIRYIDYPNNIVEGDHLYHSLVEALDAASAEYGIAPEGWRELSTDEISEIGSHIR